MTTATQTCGSSQSPDYEYRAALAMNNMATTLLKKGYYQNALNTLSESLTMMQIAFVPEQERVRPESQGRRHNCKKTTLKSSQEIYQQASKRYAMATRPAREHLGENEHVETREDAPCHSSTPSSLFEVHLIEDDDVLNLRSAVRYGPSSSVVYPVRISGSSSSSSYTRFHKFCPSLESEDNGNANLDLGNETDTAEITKHFGIILYNHGLANWMISQSPFKKVNKVKYSRRSQISLQTAETTFLASLQQPHETHSEEPNVNQCEIRDLDHLQEYSLVLLLLAQTLNAQCSLLADQESTAPINSKIQEIHQTVASICSNVDEQEEYWLSLIPRPVAIRCDDGSILHDKECSLQIFQAARAA